MRYLLIIMAALVSVTGCATIEDPKAAANVVEIIRLLHP